MELKCTHIFLHADDGTATAQQEKTTLSVEAALVLTDRPLVNN